MNRFHGAPSTSLIALCVLMCASCTDLFVDNPGLDGRFTGTFTFINAKGVASTGSVTFTFEGDRYSCVPQYRYLPPAGAGLFVRNPHSLMLRDTVPHTAEFDGTLVLGGEFTLTFDGSHLVLQQDDVPLQRHRVIDLTRQ